MPTLADPAVALAMQLAQQVAAGNSTAARELVASAPDVSAADVAGKTLADAAFNAQAKDALLKALLAFGVVSDLSDPQYETMGAEDVAAMVSSFAPTMAPTAAPIMPALSDPAVLLALELAQQVKNGNSTAACQVVGSAAASKDARPAGTFKAALYKSALPIQTASCSGMMLADADFNKLAKDALLKALIAAGLASGPADPQYAAMAAEDMASAVADFAASSAAPTTLSPTAIPTTPNPTQRPSSPTPSYEPTTPTPFSEIPTPTPTTPSPYEIVYDESRFKIDIRDPSDGGATTSPITLGEETLYMYFDSNIEDFAPMLPKLSSEILSFLNFDFQGDPLKVRIELFPGSVVLRIVIVSDEEGLAREKANEVVGFYRSNKTKALVDFPLEAVTRMEGNWSAPFNLDDPTLVDVEDESLDRCRRVNFQRLFGACRWRTPGDISNRWAASEMSR